MIPIAIFLHANHSLASSTCTIFIAWKFALCTIHGPSACHGIGASLPTPLIWSQVGRCWACVLIAIVWIWLCTWNWSKFVVWVRLCTWVWSKLDVHVRLCTWAQSKLVVCVRLCTWAQSKLVVCVRFGTYAHQNWLGPFCLFNLWPPNARSASGMGNSVLIVGGDSLCSAQSHFSCTVLHCYLNHLLLEHLPPPFVC